MMSYDIQPLLTEINPTNPCGTDVTYDPSFGKLENLLQNNSSSILGQESTGDGLNWKEIASQSYDLLKVSKHLRIAVYFAFSIFKLEGFVGFQKGLEFLKTLLEHFWDNLYPRLDPDDHFDPVERINILKPLSLESAFVQSPLDFIKAVIETPFCKSGQLGAFAYRDYQIANGDIALLEGNTAAVPTMSQIKAAIKDTPHDELMGTLSALEESVKCLSEINSVFSRLANNQSPNFENLESVVVKLIRFIKSNLEGEQSGNQEEAEVGSGNAASVGGQSTAAVIQGIRSKNDVIRMLDMICNYFENNEPSSPVPLLLRRAQKLTSSTFMELIEDLCPDAMNQVKVISGNTEQKGS
jgi:type VI secretion system protein ImpA